MGGIYCDSHVRGHELLAPFQDYSRVMELRRHQEEVWHGVRHHIRMCSRDSMFWRGAGASLRVAGSDECHARVRLLWTSLHDDARRR
jgi:hypothetical protein